MYLCPQFKYKSVYMHISQMNEWMVALGKHAKVTFPVCLQNFIVYKILEERWFVETQRLFKGRRLNFLHVTSSLVDSLC